MGLDFQVEAFNTLNCCHTYRNQLYVRWFFWPHSSISCNVTNNLLFVDPCPTAGCSDKCEADTDGNAVCSCNEGRILGGDGKTCEGGEMLTIGELAKNLWGIY